MGETPFFVVGCGRSGSTMLRLMLDAHPELAVPGESHFIPPLWRSRRRYVRGGRLDATGLARDIARTPHFGHWKIPAEPFFARVEALEDATFAGVVEQAFLANAEHHGKRRWADKTPIYVRRVELLAELWPEARFVHLIRDGRDVALSYLGVPWGPRSVSRAAWKWRRDVSAGRAAGPVLGADRYLELRYEELVADPGEALRRLCGFVELEFHPSMLEHHAVVDRDRLAPATGIPFHARAAGPVEARARDWRTDMAPRDVAGFEAVAGGLLEDLGYGRGGSTSLGGRVGAAARAAAYAAVETADEGRKALRRIAGRPSAGVGAGEDPEAGPGG
ncbi:MAG: sulfotransferase [Actinomycetota bacterium]